MADSLNNAVPNRIVESSYYDRYGVEHDSLLGRFDKWNKKLEGHYSEWMSEARECFDLVAGVQWTEEERTTLEASNRAPVTFNRIQPTIDAVGGAEIQGRQQIQYFPREVGDSAVSEILTQGAEYEMGGCDGEEEDSDAFRDCLICGVGITEMRTENEDGEVRIIKERVDPLETQFDPGKAKSCFADARFLRRKKHMDEDEFMELWPDQTPIGDDETGKRVTVVDPRVRYTHGKLGDNDKGEVVVCEWQWFETDKYYLAQGAGEDGQPTLVEHDQDSLDEALELNPQLHHVSQTRKTFWRAFTNGPVVLSVEQIETGAFTYTAITGKRDRNKGTFYGLVRPMKDPQKFANKFFSQILHIINSNAKGGVMVEEGAVDDIRNFEESYASADAVTWMKDGAISQGRFQQKTPPAYPMASDRMMQESNNAIPDVTGVNKEILGLADRDQPGILEQQRKQSAYGILAVFFDSRRRYLKMTGRKLLKFMQKYLPADKLMRIVGEDGSPQYVPWALTQETETYDIIVDEAPQSPNQKLQTFQVLTQMMPLLQNADLSARAWGELIKYSPLPAGLSQKLAAALTEQEQAEAQAAQPQQELAQRGANAEVADKEANAQKAANEAQAIPIETEIKLMDARARLVNATNDAVNDLQSRTNSREPAQ